MAPAIGGTGEPASRRQSRFSLGPATQTSLILNWQAGSDNIGIDHYNVSRDLRSGLGPAQGRRDETAQPHVHGTHLRHRLLARAGGRGRGRQQVGLAEAIWYPVRTLACDPSSPPPPPSGGTPDTQPPAKAGSLTGAGDADVIGSELAGRRRQHRYRSLQRLSRGTSDQASGQLKVAETNSSATYTGLTCGTDHSLALVAEDAAGSKSDLAEAIWYRFAPSPATPRRHRRRRRVKPPPRRVKPPPRQVKPATSGGTTETKTPGRTARSPPSPGGHRKWRRRPKPPSP